MNGRLLIDGDFLINQAAFAVATSNYRVDTSDGVTVREFRYAKDAKAFIKTHDLEGKVDLNLEIDPGKFEDAVQYCRGVLMQARNYLGLMEYVFLFSGRKNYRYLIDSEYKANRKENTRISPHLQPLREYLIEKAKGRVMHGCEADDGLGIMQRPGDVIASRDKDLLQIPGKHYDWKTLLVKDISVDEGLRRFYGQLLTGDTSDNIPGIQRIGPKTAQKLLGSYRDELSMWNVVWDTYQTKMAQKSLYELYERVVMNASMLWLLRGSTKKSWLPPDYATNADAKVREIVDKYRDLISDHLAKHQPEVSQ